MVIGVLAIDMNEEITETQVNKNPQCVAASISEYLRVLSVSKYQMVDDSDPITLAFSHGTMMFGDLTKRGWF